MRCAGRRWGIRDTCWKKHPAALVVAPDLSEAIARAAAAAGGNGRATGRAARRLIPRQLDLLAFFADRLKVQLRDQGARHDLVDAVFALEGQDDLVLIVRRVEALGKFLDTEDGKNLLAGYKRATNIIRIEEKRDAREYVGRPDPRSIGRTRNGRSSTAIDTAKAEASAAVAREDFAAAMRAMAKLRPHVDAFFDKVTVNVAGGAGKAKSCVRTGSGCSTKSARRPARSLISRASRASDLSTGASRRV